MSQVAVHTFTATAVATVVLALTRLAFRIGLLVFAAWLYRQSRDLKAIDKAATLAKAFSAPIARLPCPRRSSKGESVSGSSQTQA